MSRLTKFIIFSFIFVAFFSVSQNKVHAVTAANWQAGRITDDSVFYNNTSMDVNEVQNFLNQQVPVCDTWGTKKIGSQTRAQYGSARGYPPPYTCLKDYYEHPTTKVNKLGGKPIAPGSMSAAQIIKLAADSFQISPKALIVMLQKEQALVNDDWPADKKYRSAMGTGCPDTAPCDAEYYGFYNQVTTAARWLRKYTDNPNSYRYKPYQNNAILYNPNVNCGSSPVYINSRATAALYVYTPYQPNQPALSNLYGLGDGCSAYGNRNYWRLFNDWFVTSNAVSSDWQYISQESYTDAAYSKPANLSAASPNSTYYLRLRAKNTGPTNWQSGTLKLGTSNPQNRSSAFCNNSWAGCTRPANLKESSVAPGDVGTFEFSIRTPNAYGDYREYFTPLSEGQTWLKDFGVNWYISIKPPTYSWGFVSQNTYADSSRAKPLEGAVLAPNTTYYTQLRARNTGNIAWTNSGPNPVTLGTSSTEKPRSSFCDNTWPNCGRPALLKESSVAPGDIGTFEFSIRTPSAYGDYREYFRPLAENKAWMNDIGQNWMFSIKPPTYSWQWQNQAAYADSSKQVPIDLTKVNNGKRLYLVLKALNTSNIAWTNSGPNPVTLGTSSTEKPRSSFCDNTWPNCGRPALLKESSVAPGDIGTFEFWATAPYAQNGTVFKEYFRPLAENKAWMNDIGQNWMFTMKSPELEWGYNTQGIYIDSSRTQPISPGQLKTQTTYYLTLRAKNTGGQSWLKNEIFLGTSNPQDRASSFCDSSWVNCGRAATLKGATVNPGEIGIFEFSIKTPLNPGSYKEYFTPLAENKTWMNDIGQNWDFNTTN